MLKINKIDISSDYLALAATQILERHGHNLPDIMVVLPSTRACATIRHKFLDAAPCDAILLPRILTPSQLFNDLAERLGLDASRLCPDILREPVLSAWLKQDTESNADHDSLSGMAGELIGLFDELRMARLDPADPGIPADALDLLQADAVRLSEAWAVYRRSMPFDRVDLLSEILDTLNDHGTWPGPRVTACCLIGFAEMPQLTAQLFDRIGTLNKIDLDLYLPEITDHDARSRLFLATYAARTVFHPLSVGDRVGRALGAAPGTESAPDTRAYPERIGDLEPQTVLDNHAFRLMPCPEPEDESCTVAAAVVQALQDNPRQRIAVATSDRSLAERITAQLRDAGLDLDDSGGTPLTATSEGVLVHTLLHGAVSGPSAEDLLEIISHPLVNFGRPDYRQLALRIERDLLRGRVGGSNLAACLGRARAKGLEDLVELITELQTAVKGLADLNQTANAGITDHLEALRRALAIVAPDLPTEPASTLNGESTLAWQLVLQLLEQLQSSSGRMPRIGAGGFMSILDDMMSGSTLRERRSVHLPVQITGLLEARLEHFDLLILAGMNDDVFPGREPRPLLLGQQWRRETGLGDWRSRLGLQAELFLRLIHNGDRVLISWSTERDGQPTLPSAFVERLSLGLIRRPRPAERAPLYRTAKAETASVIGRQSRFSDGIRSHLMTATPAPLTHISHTALQDYRDCPYRFLLKHRFKLRETDELVQDLESKDYGNLVHETMERFLQPGHAGLDALRKGDADDARRILLADIDEIFAQADDALYGKTLLEAKFRSYVDGIIDFEIKRAAAWLPQSLEAPFSYTLEQLYDWLGDDQLPALNDGQAAVRIKGKIDRLDVSTDGQNVQIIDYKTGGTPKPAEVKDGRSLQLQIYALAVLAGEVNGRHIDRPEQCGGAFYIFDPAKAGFVKPQLNAAVDLREQGRQILSLALEILDETKDHPLAPEIDPRPMEKLPCTWCRLRGVCRVDEYLLDRQGGQA
jgi:inactivated superfamily I helicase/RecB family exonuclease